MSASEWTVCVRREEAAAASIPAWRREEGGVERMREMWEASSAFPFGGSFEESARRLTERGSAKAARAWERRTPRAPLGPCEDDVDDASRSCTHATNASVVLLSIARG